MHELFFQKASHQVIKAVVLQVCFPYQDEPPLGTCWKCKFLGPTQGLLNLQVEPSILGFNNPSW